MIKSYRSTDPPKPVSENRGWWRFQIQVIGGGVIRIARTRSELETQAAGIDQGLSFAAADTIPPVELTWFGPLWAIGSLAGGVTVELAMHTGSPGGEN